jgi:hypothetical protein
MNVDGRPFRCLEAVRTATVSEEDSALGPARSRSRYGRAIMRQATR